MENILIVLLGFIKMGVFFIGGSILVMAGLLLIQLISYQVFGYNLYKKLSTFLFNR